MVAFIKCTDMLSGKDARRHTVSEVILQILWLKGGGECDTVTLTDIFTVTSPWP